MGAKAKSDGERMSGHLDKLASKAARLRKQNLARLEALNVDPGMLQSEDPVQQRKLSKAVQQLEDTAVLMRQRRLPSATTAPTPERMAHATSEPRIIQPNQAVSPAHQFDWLLDTPALRNKLSTWQYQAANRLRDCHLKMQPRSAVADTTGTGGASDPSGRLVMTETQEIAARQYGWVMRKLSEDHVIHGIVENFVLEVNPEGRERCLTLQEYGYKLAKIGGENQGRAAGITALIVACDRLNAVWRAYRRYEREQCVRTDLMMRSAIGRRAGAQGWINALWRWCREHGQLPEFQGDIDLIRARHDEEARRLREAPPAEQEAAFHKANERVAIAFRDETEGNRVRIAG